MRVMSSSFEQELEPHTLQPININPKPHTLHPPNPTGKNLLNIGMAAASAYAAYLFLTTGSPEV